MPGRETQGLTQDEREFRPDPNVAAELSNEHNIRESERIARHGKKEGWNPKNREIKSRLGEFEKRRLQALKEIDEEEARYLALEQVKAVATRDEAKLGTDEKKLKDAEDTLEWLNRVHLEKNHKKYEITSQ